MKEKRKPKKKWSKRWLVDRKKYAAANLLMELENNEPCDFQNYLCMDSELFQNLLRIVRQRIEKKNTVMREAVSAEERLSVTLR